MTEIDRERGQQRLHIDPVPIPLADPLDREPMAQRLQAWTTPARAGLNAQPPAQRDKPVPKRFMAEHVPLLGDKHHISQRVVAQRGPHAYVRAELRGGRKMQGDQA